MIGDESQIARLASYPVPKNAIGLRIVKVCMETPGRIESDLFTVEDGDFNAAIRNACKSLIGKEIPACTIEEKITIEEIAP